MSEHIWIHANHGPALRAAGLNRFADFMRIRPDAVLSKHRHRETVAIGGQSPSRPAFYLKRVFRVPFLGLLLDCLRLRMPRSLPQHEWSAVRRMQASGIGVMDDLAVGWRTRFGLTRQAFILLRPVSAQKNLLDYIYQTSAAVSAGHGPPAPSPSAARPRSIRPKNPRRRLCLARPPRQARLRPAAPKPR